MNDTPPVLSVTPVDLTGPYNRTTNTCGDLTFSRNPFIPFGRELHPGTCNPAFEYYTIVGAEVRAACAGVWSATVARMELQVTFVESPTSSNSYCPLDFGTATFNQRRGAEPKARNCRVHTLAGRALITCGEPRGCALVTHGVRVPVALFALACLALGTACGLAGGREPHVLDAEVKSVGEDGWPTDLPQKLGSEGSTPLTDAVQVWRIGAAYVPVEEAALEWDGQSSDPFVGIDSRLRNFLEDPYLQDAVPFGRIRPTFHEWRIRRALKDESPIVRLQALVVLMKVRAPESVEEQWRTLSELRRASTQPLTQRLLDVLEREFSAEVLMSYLEVEGTKEKVIGSAAHQWVLRAVGVTQCWQALDILRKTSATREIGSSQAAGRSLEDFEGWEANEALLECAVSMGSAGRRAARALLRRDADLLADGLLDAEVAGYNRVHRALFIGRAGRTVAVPLLCAAARDVSWRDAYEMFTLLEQLATEDHLDLIRELPSRVPAAIRHEAVATRAAVLARLQR